MTVVPDWFCLGRCVVRIRKVAGVLIGAAVMFAMAAPAAAQDKTLANASVGYLYFHGATIGGLQPANKSYTKGLLLSAAGRIHDKISGLVEISAVFDPQLGTNVPGLASRTCTPQPSCALSQADAHGALRVYDVGTGLRFGSGSGKKLEFFGQFILAWQRRSGKFISTDGDTSIPQGTRIGGTNPATNTGSTANDGLNIQPGAGIDFWLTKKVGVRIQGDYEKVKADTALPAQTLSNSVPSRWTNNSRVVVSLVFQGVKK